MKKYLIVKGCAGLGNRLTTLLKAIEYAKASGRVLFVDWDDGMFSAEGDNAFFKFFNLKCVDYTDNKKGILELYKKGVSCYPHELEYEDICYSAYNRFHVVTPLVSKFVPYKYIGSSLLRGKWTYVAGLQSVQKNTNEVKSYIDVIRNLRKGDNFPFGGVLCRNLQEVFVLFYDHRPRADMKMLSKYLLLNDSVLCLIENYANKYHIEETIGVHVRYTDKKPYFFLSKLYKKIGNELKNNPKQRIFLCTDNNDIVDEFKRRYGENVFQRDKYIPKVPDGYGIHNWARQNSTVETKEKMAIDSIVDMWLLSKVKVLYWQGNSSFSYISKNLKNDPSTTINWMKVF